MSPVGEPCSIYEQRIKSFEERLRAMKKVKGYISLFRLLTVVLLVVALLYWWDANRLLALSAVAICVIGFIFLVSRSSFYTNAIKNIEQLIAVNSQELDVIGHNYFKFEDGREFASRVHYYAEDFDIFGKASLFQFINRCTADQSRQLLASHLVNGLRREEVVLQQKAVQELAPNLDWRQQFLAFGKTSPVSFSTEKKIMTWLGLEKDLFTSGKWKVVANVVPIGVLVLAGLFAASLIPSPLFFFLMMAAAIFAFYCSKKINRTHLILSRAVDEVKTLYDQIHWMEKQDFASEKIVALKSQMAGGKETTVSREILRLTAILDNFDMRLNAFLFFFLNIIFLWDLRQMLALNDWKERNSGTMREWFRAIAEMEVLTSIASLAFNEPEWCFPTLSSDYFTFEGLNLGHPLIDKKIRVVNSFAMHGLGKVVIITGSNIGGKSTFLRSIGVNVVLALIGSPVCATSLRLSPTKLMSSMRIADNLAESTSTFYAELKRLQMIIEEVNGKGRVFYSPG